MYVSFRRYNLFVSARISSNTILGKLLLKELKEWLTPPDPFTNYNIACSTQHDKTATWVFNEDIFTEWELSGSMLWIHGKGMFSYTAAEFPCS